MLSKGLTVIWTSQFVVYICLGVQEVHEELLITRTIYLLVCSNRKVVILELNVNQIPVLLWGCSGLVVWDQAAPIEIAV